MRAAFHHEQGAVDVLRVGEKPDAVAAADEVLVRVRASSLDRVDLYCREGSHGMRIRSPHIGGRDVAGTIVSIGPLAGARYPQLRAGQAVVGMAVRSAHAELVAVPGAWVFPLPDGCSWEQAAAIPTAGRTAYDGLTRRARLLPGEDVLVVAGGSGVGSFGIQIARAAGARVFATVGANWKAEPARALGAVAALDHHADDLAARVRDLTGGAGVHAVLDPVGAATFPAGLNSLRPGGRYVTTGVTAGHRAELHLGRVFEHGLTVTGVGRPGVESIRETMIRLLALVTRGSVKPAVHAVLPLERIADAHEMLERGDVFGKVVLTV
jgi:NADPH:quinone reductase-like Zn-dependent oxidoreductase